MKKIKVALVGNPNCGKTTIFNHLTGFRQKVGNYPGVTIEQKNGIKKTFDAEYEIIDLPGIYSINSFQEDERVAKNYILDEKPDVIINILDASNLKKSLFLTTELLELNIPVILALNMVDISKKKEISINLEFLKKILEVEAVEIVATKKEGLQELLKKTLFCFDKKIKNGINIKYSQDIESEILKVEKEILEFSDIKDKRFFAYKLIEGDIDILKKIKNQKAIEEAKISKNNIEKKYKDHFEIISSNQRHKFIDSIINKLISYPRVEKKSFNEKVDDILTHKYFGFLIFFLIMFLIFEFTFIAGSYPSRLISSFVEFTSNNISIFWPKNYLPIFRSLCLDGVLAGVGSVIAFLPNILFLFFSISILEETGYMARAAFILDKFMHKIGLHGKSFIPLLIGFGCSVPAILSTRIMENKKDRLITIMVLPLIACSAKLVVFTLIIPAFFTKFYQPFVLLFLYFFGIFLAILMIKIFKITLFKGKNFSFVMELPELKMPSFYSSLLLMWDKAKEYIQKAGTLILGFSIVLWFLGSFPKTENEIVLKNTYMGKIGNFFEPIFKPLGFDWKIDTSLISSFAAKEVFVAQLGVIYSIEGSSSEILQDQLKNDYTFLQAISILIFILISSPCITTIAVTKKELKSYKWAFFQFGYLTLLAYVVSLIFYQGGRLFYG